MKSTLIPLSLLLLVGCQSASPTLTPEQINAQIAATVALADLNKDGQLSNEELKSSGNNPSFWIAIASGVIGLLGAGTAMSAKKDANDLYDATHAPVATQVPVATKV